MFAKCHKYINKYSRLYGRWGVPHCQFCCRRFLALYLAPFLPRTSRQRLPVVRLIDRKYFAESARQISGLPALKDAVDVACDARYRSGRSSPKKTTPLAVTKVRSEKIAGWKCHVDLSHDRPDQFHKFLKKTHDGALPSSCLDATPPTALSGNTVSNAFSMASSTRNPPKAMQ
jgi:hypothetical protein